MYAQLRTLLTQTYTLNESYSPKSKLLSLINECSKELNTSRFEYVCQICETYIHETSKHCRECNRCVEVFDHHCHWLNNCIGIANYRSFLWLVSLYLALSLFLLGISIHFLVLLYGPERHLETYLFVLSCILVVMNTLKVGALAHLLSLHVFLIVNHMTTFDYIMEQRELDELKHQLTQEVISKEEYAI